MSKNYSDSFYIVNYYVKWVTTSWTHSMTKILKGSHPTQLKNRIRIRKPAHATRILALSLGDSHELTYTV